MNQSLKRIALVVMLALVLCINLYFAFRSENRVKQKPIVDDTYMYLAIADNFAAGNGLSDNGTNLTNGFQPLYLFVITPIFVLVDDLDTALRLVIILNIVIYFLVALILRFYLINLIVTDEQGRLVANILTIFFLGAPLIMDKFIMSMDIGLVLLFYLALFAVYIQSDGIRTIWHAILFGIVLGFAILTRIDVGIFAVVFAGVYLLKSRTRDEIILTIIRVSVVAIAALIVTSPWWIYNYTVFGHIMPTSGQALAASPFEYGGGIGAWYPSFLINRMRAISHSLAEVLMPLNFLWLHDYLWLVTGIRILLVAMMFVLAIIGFRRHPRTEASAVKSPFIREFLLMGIISALLYCLYYASFNVAVWFYPRYFFPISLIAFGVVYYFAIWQVLKIIGQWVLVGISLLFVMYATSLIAFDVYGVYYSYTSYYPGLLPMVNQYVPQDAKLGAIESGYLSYVRDGVYNLDGKTNAAANTAIKNGNIFPYLEDEGIDWVLIFSWQPHYAPNPEEAGWELVAAPERWQIWHRTGDATPDT